MPTNSRRLRNGFVPFLNICKENHTAIRIGVNHGSLSDRIRNRYGDTPEGIVESCMEFLRICKKKFPRCGHQHQVFQHRGDGRSMRLLVDEMEKEGMNYPLHLGVTEAGEGEDGRIKSAVGIGALLADGIGDTRESKSERRNLPAEIPVARHLVDYIGKKQGQLMIPAAACPSSTGCALLAGKLRRWVISVVIRYLVVISNRINGESTICENKDAQPDYIYIGGKMPKQFVARTELYRRLQRL